ncbi:MAG: HAMP domain-containing sensor histidine kinase [Spirochaetaceae bacterium]|nr:HAMP domain-containing sensor histidine kinase [Spirochaetaceae bacterium]
MRLRTQLLLLVAAVALSPVLVSAIYAGASAVLRQPTDIAQRDFPLAMRAIRDEVPRVLAGEQDSIDLPDGVVLTVLDTENLVLFSTAAEYGPGAAVDPRELLRASRADRDIRTMLEPLFNDGELAGTFLLSMPSPAVPALARPGWLGWMLRYGLVIFLPLAVIAAAGAWIIATGVNRSVTRLQRATRRVADGDLDFELTARGNSELASLARSFDAMRGALKEETERRSRLLAAVTHDVKTPLTAIKGYLEAIADGMAEDRDTRERYLGIIAEKADLLGARVSELIEYVRLSSSQWQIDPVPTGLAAFHRELCDGIAGDAAVLKRCLRTELRIPERLAAPLDAALLSRAYENILDNALRFTPEDGTVTVSASVAGGDLEVRIADSGPGIAAEDLPHLFDPFYRGAGTSSGFGLGLSIARSITDAHGFSLDVDSRESPGTTFVIRVPARLISAGAGQHRIMGTEVIPTDVQHAAAGVEPVTVSKDLRAAPSAADLASTPSAGLGQGLRG